MPLWAADSIPHKHSRIEQIEEKVHGRSRDLDDWDDIHFGVHKEMLYAKKKQGQAIPGAQWTGIVTSIAIKMLESGMVEGVVCVQVRTHKGSHVARPSLLPP